MKVKTDQQIRTQANAFPPYKQKNVVIRQDEREHRKHEQVHVSEKAVVTALVRHVTGGVNVDQHAHAGHEKKPDTIQRIEQKSGIDVERGATTLEADEALVFRKMLKQAKKVIIVTDSSKFGKVSPALICPLSEVHMLITDTGATEESLQPYRQRGIEVQRV